MEQAQGYGWGLPPDYSTHGHFVDWPIHLLHWFMALLFVGWLAFMLYAL